MKNRSPKFMSSLAAGFRPAALGLSLLALSATARAATYTWDGSDSATNILWSNALNWTADSGTPGSSDAVIFNNTGGSATTDPTSQVSTNTTIQTLNFTNLSPTLRQTVEIDENVALSLSASGSGIILGVGLYTSSSSANGSRAVFTGDGTLNVTGTSRAISVVNNSAEALLDLSGLANFNANISELRIGTNVGSFGDIHNLRGRVKLAETSTITATSIYVGGGSGSSQNHIAYLDLGQTTTLNVGTLSVGLTKSQGYMSFQNPAGANNLLTIRGTAGGTSRANWTIGSYGGSGSPVTLGQVDLTGGEVDARINNLIVGQSAGANSGAITGTLTYEDGLIDATNINVAYNTATTSSSLVTNGTITMSGTAQLRADNLYLGRIGAVDTLRQANGRLIVNGGEVTVDLLARLGSTFAADTTVTNSTGELQINGGLVTINASNGLEAGGLTTNAASRSILTLAGGTLNMTGKAIGSSTNHIKTLNFESGTLSNVGQINGGDTGLEKTTAGVLTVSGTNTFTGPTLVSAGTLVLAGTVTSDVTVSSTATLGGGGSTTGSVTVNTGSFVAPGATGAIGTLSASSLTWNGDSTFQFQLSGASSSDRIDLTGAFTMGTAGTYVFNFLGTGVDGGVYTLLNFDSTTFTNANQFSYTNLASGVYGAFTLNEDSLVFTAVPEPGTVFLAVAGLGLVFIVRRRRQREF